MKDDNHAVNSQVLREVLHEITIDSSFPAFKQRDNTAVLTELSKRLKERYDIAIEQFKLEPRDTTYITVEAVRGDTSLARVIVSHFANTLFISKRKHFASWTQLAN